MHTVQMHALQQVSGCRGGSGSKHDRCYRTAWGPLWEQGWHRQASLAIKKTDWIDPTATCVEPKVEKTFVTEQQSLPKENMVWAESDWNSLLEALEWFKDTFVSCSTCCVPSEVAEPICHGEIKFQKRDKTKKQREVGLSNEIRQDVRNEWSAEQSDNINMWRLKDQWVGFSGIWLRT